jgi:signal transduction histidine kinase
LSFTLGGLLLATMMSGLTYTLARNYLVEQREQRAMQQAFADAAYVRSGLLLPSAVVEDVLRDAAPSGETSIFIDRDGWYSTSLATSSDAIPSALIRLTRDGRSALVWTRIGGQPAVVIGIPMPAVDAEFYEVAMTSELDRTLDTLARVLAACSVLTALAALGRWASGRVLAPLNDVAGAAARIAGGEMETRLPVSDDPELVTIIGSFNAMVDALADRLDRDARFTSDVSHELRSPLTTLTTSVQLLEARREELPKRAQRTLDLMTVELDRFRTMLESLLELGRLDAGGGVSQPKMTHALELVRQVLADSGRSPALAEALDDEAAGLQVGVDRLRIGRALGNLFDNADLHGGGLLGVRVRGEERWVCIEVHDGGPGVDQAERTRVFDRFVRGGSRGSRPGAGLGLSLVQETVRAHRGNVILSSSTTFGGALVTVSLPREGADDG